MPQQMIVALRSLSPLEAAVALLLENLLIFLLAIAVGRLLVRWFADRRVSPEPGPLEPAEVLLTISTIVLNSLVTWAGWWLWRAGVIQFRADVGLRSLADVVVLLLFMDVAMYILHRVAHLASLFPLVHRTHHRYDKPRPLTLFVLNPAEALSFGGLWLLVVCVYQASWLGMGLYLALNVLFGMLGHLGVEPLPDRWRSLPLLKYITTSTFHTQHHCDPGHNFGFYTLIWDQLLGTLSPRYASDFGRMQREFHELDPGLVAIEPGTARP